MSCHRFVSHPLLHTSSLPSLSPFPLHPSIPGSLVRHALLTDVRCMGQNPEALPQELSPLGNQRKSTLWRLPGSKFSDSLYKGAFWVCVSEAGARFQGESTFEGLLCYRVCFLGPCRAITGCPASHFFRARAAV